LPEGHAKAGTLRVRVTPDELEAIETAANAKKQSVSEWIRCTLSAAL
jgi:predicted HicB family RNase H-like nuclease